MAKSAKKSKKKTPSEEILVVQAALTRAVKVLEAEYGKGELSPSGYPHCLDVHIEGDVVVAQGVAAGKPKTVPDFDADTLLAAMYQAAGDEADAIVGRALSAIKRAQTNETTKAKLIDAGKACVTRATELAMSRGVTTKKASGAKKGAVSGKPLVRVHGTAGAHTVEVDVEAETD